MHDVIIVGGGPAGLSAALVLGRALRTVLLFDSGEYRNAESQGLHGFLTREGIAPATLRQLGRDQLAPYAVDISSARVVGAARAGKGFVVTLADGRQFSCRKLLLATGVVDQLPPIPGLAELWGRQVFACPYCDGYEFRGRPLGVIGHEGAALAVTVNHWAGRTTLFANGGVVPHADRHKLNAAGIAISDQPIRSLSAGPDARGQTVVRVETAWPPTYCAALFLKSGVRQRSSLAEQLGLSLDGKLGIPASESATTEVPGLYVAGDASVERLLSIQAAAEGAAAAVNINQALIAEG